ncbi:hypothetical protein LCGC14_0197940 [marine sediment metagenome]|uniref:HEPN domain-containing protein n=1 Tax=marine sediment metagenome TaxID=412755 RepID=A0A0F9X3I8_9ZZZZ|nr:hypothetical protein [Maribacter sp.]HDZ04827.1 hypothetical protein [Maribacter sp.]HEA81606.1 hypothetical protein [Maribacter sp.]
MEKNEINILLTKLKLFQMDYYTKGQAIEAHNLILFYSDLINFKNNLVFNKFIGFSENLKKSESIEDTDAYAKVFANNLIQIILILNKQKSIN